jgi:hypothetical protein
MTKWSHRLMVLTCLVACTSRALDGQRHEDSEGPELPEDWIVGTFSNIPSGCVNVQSMLRFVVHEDGRFDIIENRWGWDNETSEVREWRAAWEQREPGSYHVMRVEEFAQDREYPIGEGYELEVIRFDDCVVDAYGGGALWQQVLISRHGRDSRSRLWPTAMREGALCVDWYEPGPLMCPQNYHYSWFCEGTPLPPTCER